MPTPLVTQNYPNDFQVVTFPLNATTSGFTSEDSGNLASCPILYADRDLAIDSITCTISVAGSSSAAINVRKTSAGTATTPTTPLFHIGVASTPVKLHATDIVGTATGNTFVSLATPSNDTNIVRTGNWVGLTFAGTTSAMRGLVQIRFRSAIA